MASEENMKAIIAAIGMLVSALAVGPDLRSSLYSNSVSDEDKDS